MKNMPGTRSDRQPVIPGLLFVIYTTTVLHHKEIGKQVIAFYCIEQINTLGKPLQVLLLSKHLKTCIFFFQFNKVIDMWAPLQII